MHVGSLGGRGGSRTDDGVNAEEDLKEFKALVNLGSCIWSAWITQELNFEINS